MIKHVMARAIVTGGGGGGGGGAQGTGGGSQTEKIQIPITPSLVSK